MKTWNKKRLSEIAAIGLTVWGGLCFGDWTYNPTAKTLTTGEGDNLIKIVSVSKSGTNLTIGQNYDNASAVIPEDAVLDFTEPITDATDSAIVYKIVGLSNYALRSHKMKKVILPSDELTIGN